MYLQVPKDTIVFISGVPGSGKTTVAYELFKNYCDFRIVEETDIIREILRGYRKHLALMGISIPDEITPHNVFLDYATASRQCEVMMNSIIAIVHRQQRKEIPTIINGVHIIPEILYDNMLFSSHIAYVVLAVKRKRQAYIKKKIRDKENQAKREEEQSNFGAEENTVWDRLEVQNEELVAAVQQLKPKARFIVTGYVLKGKTFKELAQETKLTERAAASTYYRSIEKLRIKMEKEK